MMKIPTFNEPKQVMFHDIDNPGHWCVGIAYGTEIICACCGGTFDIEELCELSEGYVDQAIYVYDSWIPFQEEIGGDVPKGLAMIERDGEWRIMEDSVLEREAEEIEQASFLLDEAEEEQAQAIFANTWVDGIAMPEI